LYMIGSERGVSGVLSVEGASVRLFLFPSMDEGVLGRLRIGFSWLNGTLYARLVRYAPSLSSGDPEKSVPVSLVAAEAHVD
jgi:hypothetical protein